jgi:hypothetical protein
MSVFRSRGEVVGYTETVQLRALFKGSDGNPKDLDAFPTITIVQPSGNVALAATSIGIYRLSEGLYGYDFTIGLNSSLGVWNDIWDGVLNGFNVSGSFNFVVQNTQMPQINTDGYVHLGDDPGFNYSQIAIQNINKLLKTLKARLNSSGKSKSKDEFGNEIYVDCDIYTVDTLVTFLANSLTMFNEIPHFTFFGFDHTQIIDQFHDIIVQGAVIHALSSKALIERGREFTITDNGINFNPPSVSDMLNSQYGSELQNHFEKLKLIKFNMKPSPKGLGTLTVAASRNPAIARLRHLRARQLF